MSRLDAWSSGSNHRIGKHLFCLVVLSPLYRRRFKAPFVFCEGSLLPPAAASAAFVFILPIAAAIPLLSFRTRGGGVGCRGGALTPPLVFPLVASPPRRSEERWIHRGGVRAGSGNVTPRQTGAMFNRRANNGSRKPRK